MLCLYLKPLGCLKKQQIKHFEKYIVLNSVNKFSKPHVEKLRIFIIPQMMAIPGFLSGGFEILFSKLSQVEGTLRYSYSTVILIFHTFEKNNCYMVTIPVQDSMISAGGSGRSAVCRAVLVGVPLGALE